MLVYAAWCALADALPKSLRYLMAEQIFAYAVITTVATGRF
jgi:hypothetical protein